MNKDQLAETVVGALVVVVAAGFLAFALARAGRGEGGGGYPIYARFNRVDGVSVGSDVRMSGVKVGTVSAVTLDPKTFMAKVTLSVQPQVKLPEDTAAKIATDGLLGGAYVNVEPGGAVDDLQPGGEIAQTQGSIDLLTLLSSGLNAMAGGAAKAAGGQDAPAAPKAQEELVP